MKMSPFPSIIIGAVLAFNTSQMPQSSQSFVYAETQGEKCSRILNGDITIVDQLYTDSVANNFTLEQKMNFIRHMTILNMESNDELFIADGIQMRKRITQAYENEGTRNPINQEGYNRRLDDEIRKHMTFFIEYGYGHEFAPECSNPNNTNT